VFHPVFNPLSYLFGAAPGRVSCIRSLRGVAIGFYDLARRFWNANRIAPRREWFGNLKRCWQPAGKLSETGKYNIAQKYYF